ncbi:hypothetical protein PIB30_024904 [Stylosanthes scabra]|uniref:Uncharacterized protein n=1 Tax=Stylosanthes scabra TaxID=79078 RepID=A0ABU6S9E1_9FABA|nr:hypothetical protein [Stylosanthes scabra]
MPLLCSFVLHLFQQLPYLKKNKLALFVIRSCSLTRFQIFEVEDFEDFDGERGIRRDGDGEKIPPRQGSGPGTGRILGFGDGEQGGVPRPRPAPLTPLVEAAGEADLKEPDHSAKSVANWVTRCTPATTVKIPISKANNHKPLPLFPIRIHYHHHLPPPSTSQRAT